MLYATRRFGIIVGLLLTVAYLTGCAAYVASPVTGVLYTDVKAPITATASDTATLKSGSATVTSILGLIATGDASIETAARNGGITKIHHVDYIGKSVLGLFAEYTVVVFGE